MKLSFIGKGQAAVMLTVFGVVFCVLNRAYTDMGTALGDTVVSVMILAVLLIPIAIFAANNEQSVPSLAAERLGYFGRVIDILFFVYFIAAAGNILKRYSEFVSERYFPEANAALCVIMLGAVCIYIAHTGVETVCRMSTVLIFMLALLSVIFLVGSYKDILSFDYSSVTLPKLSVERGFKGLFPIGAAGCVCLCVMCGGMGRSTRCGAYGGIAAMLIATVLITAAVFVTLGKYAVVSEYPLADSVIYASRGGTFRNDGIFFSIWTVMCSAVISLLAACGGHSLRAAVPKIRAEGIIGGGAAVICALAEIFTGVSFCETVAGSPLPPILLISAVPLIIMIFGKGKKR